MLLLLALSIAPSIAISLYLYWRDTHEKEPVWLLIKAFFMGAVGSVLITLIISEIMGLYYFADPDSVLEQAFKAYIQVATLEELSKFVFVIFFLFPKKDFNEPFDGIMYCTMVSLGFATLENIIYVFQGGVEVAILRMFTAVPAHATFGILMGYFVGLAKFRDKRKSLILIGVLSAIVMHGTYDFFLFIYFVPGIWAGAFVSLIIGIILSARALKIHQENSPFNML